MLGYLYLLTNIRLLEKANLIVEFLNRKKLENEALKSDINLVQKFLGND
jgi:hypothetical protein|tara:strand:+ start:1157 stop:1303 length:147 start_codon:yes stop_codon:yes gene_type:complete